MSFSIVSSAAQKLGGLLVEEAKYLYEVRGKVKRLQTELEWMSCFLEDADNREHHDLMVHKWVFEIRDIAYDAEDVVDRYLHEVSHRREDGILNTMKWFSCCMFEAKTLHFVGSSIDELRGRISDMIPRMQMYGIRRARRPEDSKYKFVVREQQMLYTYTEEDPIGLETQIDVVVSQLLHNKDANVIGICGLGGLGKTTLARKVFSNSAIKERFQGRRAWIYLQKEFDRRKVFEEILVGLCKNEEPDIWRTVEELPDDELSEKICEMLKANECFVVIDGICYTHSWDELKPAFRSIECSNSKILITTRNQDLTHYVDDCGYIHHLDRLNEEDSWNLFEQKAFYKINKEVNLEAMEELGREMVSHCNGIPLVIVALGGVLGEKRTVEEWRIICENIGSYLMFEKTGGLMNWGVPEVLELCYYDLPFYLKPCFLYLGNFPVDYEIQSQRLFNLWKAEGLVTRANQRTRTGGASLDDIAESYLNQLVQRSMVEVCKRSPRGRIKSCRLHDIMRYMCLQKCDDMNIMSIVNGHSDNAGSVVSSSLGHTTLRRCALHLGPDNSWPTLLLESSASLRSLLVFLIGTHGEYGSDAIKQLQSMKKFFPQLRVLDLHGNFNIRELPRAIKNCIHLKYLSFRGTSIGVIPEWVFHFEYLETLDLRAKYIVRVHHDFQKMGRLKHLYLPGAMELKSNEKVMLSHDQLRQIETLKNFDLHFCRIDDLWKMSNLRIFSIAKYSSRCLDVEILEAISRNYMFMRDGLKRMRIMAKTINEKPKIMAIMGARLNSLEIEGRIEVDDAEIFHDSMKNVVLRDCEIGEIHLAQLEKLPQLESLKLYGKAIKGSKITFSEEAFPNLVQLHMLDIGELEEWVVRDGALPNLRTLNVKGCGKLKELPQCLPTTVRINRT